MVPAALGAGGPPTVDQLRQRDQALATRSRAAVLGLYALQSRLARAQTALDGYRAQAATLRRERAVVAERLRIARRGVAISQRRLAERVRALYERSSPDPVAVVLGAESLDAALTAIDSLAQVANGDRAVLEQVRGARASLVSLRRTLASRQARLDGVVRAAASTADALAAATSARHSYIDSLATERRLTQSRISALVAQAEAAQAKAQALEVASPPVADVPPATPVADTTAAPSSASTPTPAPAAAPSASATAPALPTVRSITVVATGYALGGRTATGLPTGWGVAAVDPSVIPLGTRFTVPGYGEAVAADIGGAIRGNTIDLWFPSVAQAEGWGRRVVTIALH